MQGFRDDAGLVWEPNRLVWFDSPFLSVQQDMLIESVTFTQDERGSITKIELVDPKAYDSGEKAKRGSKTKAGVNKSGKSWAIGGDGKESADGLNK